MRNYLILGASLSMLAGCAPFPHSEAPLATNFATAKQMKLQAGQHWQVIANDTADTLAAALAKGATCIAPAGNCPPLFVSRSDPTSAFGKAFHSQFVSRLVNQGHSVATSGPGDILVTIEAQTVKFTPDRSQYMGAGKFTMLSTGVWALREIGVNQSTGTAIVAGSVAADIYEWNVSEFAKGQTPQIELILTASATKGGKYLARSTNVYYVADGDASLYCWQAEGCMLKASAPPPPPPTLSVVGDCGPAPCYTTKGGAGK